MESIIFRIGPPILLIQVEVPFAFTSTTVSTCVEEAELPFREIIQSPMPDGFIVVMLGPPYISFIGNMEVPGREELLAM